ncbi:HEPN domain-containing protein [Microbacterium sp. ZW CA_36]|uniref:ApeA N-terminal domain 1-containing protein n=1 Tax=Microbacterium sp. ZW CA_36 TaxID=3378078 RepID=UPI003851DF2E
MDKYLLSEAHEWSGHWWLPSAPDDRVAGVLTFDPDAGLILRLIGGWNIDHRDPTASVIVTDNRMPQANLVYGMSGGQLITLAEVQFTKLDRFRVGHRGPADATTAHVETALIGCHIEDADSAVFEGAIGTIENLSSWSRLSGMQFEGVRDDNGRRGSSIVSTAIAPLVAEAGDLKITLFDMPWAPQSEFTRWGSRASIRETASLQFVSNRPRSFAGWTEELRTAGDLVSLCGLTACGLMSIRLLLPANPERYREGDPRAKVRNEVYVVQRRITRPDPLAPALEARHFVVTLDDFDFQALMQRWLDVRETFSAARGMILGLKYVPGGYVETQLIAAVAAAESMHRALDPAGPIEDGQYRQLRQQLLDAIPPEHVTWVRDRLPRNEPSLKERLLDLARRPGEFMRELVPDAEKWAKETRTARDQLAHTGETKAQSIEQMAAISEVTAAVVALNLLFELGAPVDALADALSRQPDLRLAVDFGQAAFTSHAG